MRSRPDNNRPTRSEREQKVETRSSERNRAAQIITPTPTVTTPPPTPARTTTTIFSKPLVVETIQHAPSRPIATPSQNSTTVIGDGRNRSGNRDFSVWNTPKQQPAPTPQSAPSVSAPEFSRNPARNQIANESPARIEDVQSSRPTPSENRPQNNSRIEQRIERENRALANERQSHSRSEERSVAPTISTPAPAPRPAIPAYTPPPAPVVRPSAPAYTPPPAPRVESQPAPSRPEPARSEPRSESRSESKSDSNRPKRDR